MTLATILCPIDRSPVSRRAFDYAVSLARWSGARLTVLEVIDVTPPISSTAIPEMLLIPEDVRAAVREELSELIGPALAVGVEAEFRVEEGRVAERILHESRASAADLIVMGTHGRSGVERLVLGSVAEKIVRQAPCFVLTVPPGDAHVPSSTAPFRTVLCPTDFSDVSRSAVTLAGQLAASAGARLVLMHVVDWPFGHTTGSDAVTTLRESLVAEAGRQLAALIADLPKGLAGADIVAVAGHPGRQIVAAAGERAADLIVMGVSGRGAVNLAVLGSTTHRVLREARSPILSVRRAPRASETVPTRAAG